MLKPLLALDPGVERACREPYHALATTGDRDIGQLIGVDEFIQLALAHTQVCSRLGHGQEVIDLYQFRGLFRFRRFVDHGNVSFRVNEWF